MPDWDGGWRLTRVCQSLLVVDRTLRQLVKAQARRDRPAVFVFTSDNGMSWGQKGFTFKRTPPATRVPFYLAFVGVDRPVATGATDVLLSKIDVGPTLADLAGTALVGADGVSFAPLLAGESFVGRDELLEVMPSVEESGYAAWSALRTRRWHFIRWQNGQRQLFEYIVDPWELRDLAATERRVAVELEERLDEMIVASGGRLPTAPYQRWPFPRHS